MRTISIGIVATAALACVSTARGADLDYDMLRGAEYEAPVAVPVIDWSGVYVGGHGGYSTGAFGYHNLFQPLASDSASVRAIEINTGIPSVLTQYNKRSDGPSFGAFVGYNVQVDEVVVGIEFDYTRFDLKTTSIDTNALYYNINSSAAYSTYVRNASTSVVRNASTAITDFGTIRGRVGYALGDLLPYVTGGLAVGRAVIGDHATIGTTDSSRSTYNYTTYNSNGDVNYTYSNNSSSYQQYSRQEDRSKVKTIGGIALGAGLEYAITPNILLRAEYQYVLFNAFDNHKLNINTVRGGAALKF